MIDFIKEGLTWLDVDLARNEVQHIVPAPDPEVYPDRSNMKYYLDVDIPEFPMSTIFETMITLEGREKPPVLSGGAQIYQGCAFRLENLLAGQMSISLPLKNNTLLSAVASLTTKYRLRQRIEPALLDSYQPVRTAMRAGLAMRDFVAYEHNFFTRYQADKKQFLTWQPNQKVVSRQQREYLYFLLNLDDVPDEIRLRVRITKQDGSREVSTMSSISNLRQFQVVCCQVGATVLALANDVVKYEIWLSDQDNQRFSEVRTFILDTRLRAFERFILFANSFGGFDTVRLLGKSSQETDVTRSASRKEREAGNGLDFSELQIIDVSEKSGIKVSTGIFEQNAVIYSDYLRELMLSEVVLLDTDYGFEAVNLVNGNLEYAKDRPGLVERTFEFERTYSDKNFSSMPASEKLPGRATKWVGLSIKALLDSSGKRTGKLAYERLQKVYQDDGSKVIPYAIKPNLPGDPDYIEPMTEPSITPGTTPYPNVLLSREISFKRNNCDADHMGTAPTVVIAAGTYGGESPGDGDLLAEARFTSLNTQEYANSSGTCAVNNIPVHYAIFHKIPMNSEMKVISTGQYGPVVEFRVNSVAVVSNTVGNVVPSNRLSENTYPPGTRNLLLNVQYSNSPCQPFKLKIPSKGLEAYVTAPGFYLFENVLVNSADDPFTVEVVLA